MKKKPVPFDTNRIRSVFAQFEESIPAGQFEFAVRTRTQQPKVDRRFFYDVLLQFRQAGHEVTWSNKHSYIELRFHDVPYIYHGFRKAGEALLSLTQQWKNE